ncbi:hypothetical protein Bamy02_34650 [Bacillus amyloliquefaciens]|nr:hypothetical protein Bamy02_34650 [Bacillus amyloliquefaciens]
MSGINTPSFLKKENVCSYFILAYTIFQDGKSRKHFRFLEIMCRIRIDKLVKEYKRWSIFYHI